MSSGDMFLALGANEFFDRLANGSKEEQEARKNKARQEAMRAEWNAQRAIEAQEREALAQAVKSYEEALNDPMWLAYMIKTDKTGYLRALSKAKSVFRGIDPKDEFCGMRGEDEGVNPDFVAMVEDFYLEVRKDIKKYDYQLAKYNFLRDVLIGEIESETYANRELLQEFNVSKPELIVNIKKNEFVFALSAQDGKWYPVPYERYEKAVFENRAKPFFPLAS